MGHNNHRSVHAEKLQKSSLVLDNTNKQHKVQAVQACGLLCTEVAFGLQFVAMHRGGKHHYQCPMTTMVLHMLISFKSLHW